MILLRYCDARSAGFCREGIVSFVKKYGLDMTTLIGRGYPMSGLPDNAITKRVKDKAMERYNVRG